MMFMRYPGYFVHTWNATLETEILSTYVSQPPFPFPAPNIYPPLSFWCFVWGGGERARGDFADVSPASTFSSSECSTPSLSQR